MTHTLSECGDAGRGGGGGGGGAMSLFAAVAVVVVVMPVVVPIVHRTRAFRRKGGRDDARNFFFLSHSGISVRHPSSQGLSAVNAGHCRRFAFPGRGEGK